VVVAMQSVGVAALLGSLLISSKESVMSNIISSITRKSLVAAAALAVGAGVVCTVVRADDEKMPDNKMGMKAIEPKMLEQMEKLKQVASDSEHAKELKEHMVKMMVMDHMAKMTAEDPVFMKASMELMNDPNIKKLHEEAMKEMEDKDDMKKMEDEVLADPMAMKMVMHNAMMMVMHEKGEKGGKMEKKMEERK
jgi:hypothetical protein